MAQSTKMGQGTDLWRISKHHTLTGEGGLYTGARWNTQGRPIVYLAESPAAALLEVLVHLPVAGRIPHAYTLLRIAMQSDIKMTQLVPEQGWELNPGQTQAMGDAWLKAGTTALARVPCSIVSRTWNYLLNPLHPDAEQIRIAESFGRLFDPRLLRLRSGLEKSS